MKHTAKYLILLTALALVTISCKRTEDDIFSENPVTRLNNYASETYSQLVAASNGWEVLYFMEPSSAGYAIIMKFNEDGTVKMATKNPVSSNNKYVTDESLWELIKESGAIISFPTWNDVMHAFSDPKSDGIGLGGDYEFVVKEHSNSYMRVTGRKNGAQIFMYPLPADLAWEDYFAQIDATNDRMFTGNNEILFNLVRNGEKQPVRFEDNYFGWSVGDTAAYIYGFITTPRGISFYYQDGIEVGDKLAQDFVFNDENTRLTCINEGIDAYFEAYYTAAEFLKFKLGEFAAWKVDNNDLGAETKTALDDFVTTIANSSTQENQKRRITEFRLKQNKSKQYQIEIVYRIANDIKSALVNVDIVFDGEKMTLTYLSADDNAQALFKRSAANDLDAGIQKFKNIFEGTYTLQSAMGGTLNMSAIRLTDINNSNRNLRVNL